MSLGRVLISNPLKHLGEELLLRSFVLEQLMEAILEDEGVFLLGVCQLIEALYLLLRLDRILTSVEHKQRVLKGMSIVEHFLT